MYSERMVEVHGELLACAEEGEAMHMVANCTFLTLFVTGRCNLNCSYCFSKDHLPKERMDFEIAERAIRRYIDPTCEGTVEFAGGEPFLAFPLIKRIIESTEQQFPNLRFAVQTNGTIREKDIWFYLLSKNVGIGLSLDGTPMVNDRHRGRGKMVLENLSMLGCHGAGINITTVLKKDNISEMEEFLLLCGGFSAVRTINLDIVRPGKAGSTIVPKEEQVSEMVEKMFQALEFINRRRFPPLRIREIEQIRSRMEGNGAVPRCEAGAKKALAVTPKGRLFPCASLVGDERFYLGTLGNESFDKYNALGFTTALPEGCASCTIRFLCGGGCPSRRIAYRGRGDKKASPECMLYREIYKRLNGAGT